MKNKSIKLLNLKFEKPFSCLTAYSSGIAKILDGNIDVVLIGDSLGTTLYGMKNTRGVTLDMMKKHGLSVTRNIRKSLCIIDMPYKTYENKSQAFKNADELLKYTKANMIKLEIDKKKIGIVKYLSEKKINVISHIGVTPQSYNNFKKIKVLGKTQIEKDKFIKLAIAAEVAGSKALLLECITKELAKEITSQVKIPTIGIGSSKFCDGQILVFDDLVNMGSNGSYPKFVKNFMNFNNLAKKAVKKFKTDVSLRKFPGKRNSY
tara:strand:- start:528 stop:1316 length:789 start_codon:yes stop_codon:yes gene_type:complete